MSTSFTCVSEDALRMIANGKTSAEMAARAADPSCYDHYRTAEGLRAHMGDDLAKFITHMVPGDALAAEMNALDARLAAAMAALEGDGWTPETARAALRDSGFRLAAGPLRGATS
jgi:flagellum-specific peptidoglycan hydrolase FlgJ